MYKSNFALNITDVAPTSVIFKACGSLFVLQSFNSSLMSVFGDFSVIFLCRHKRLERFYIFTTPLGLTLGYQSPLPPS